VKPIHEQPPIWTAGLFMAVMFIAATSSPSLGADATDAISPSVVQQGVQASPIPFEKLNLQNRPRATVALGSYLVNGVGDCVGCHTFPRFLRPGGTARGTNGNFTGNVAGLGSDPTSGNPFLDPPEQSLTGQMKANINADTHGPVSHTLTGVPIYPNNHFLAGGRCFGFFMSRNLTPDDSGKPRGLTEAEFIQVMRQGKDISCNKPNPPKYGGVTDPLCSPATFPTPEPPGAGVTFNPDRLQSMPWPTFHSMTDTDLKAVYAYLSSLPQATACNAAQNGCAGFSKDPRLAGVPPGTLASPAHVVGANQYIYPNTDDCPNNVNPAGGNTVGTAPPQ
jgi:hypothetical protein